MAKIGVLGAGTWGMALARMLSNSGREVTVWSALPQEVDELSRTRRQKNLPGMVIPDEIKFTKKLRKPAKTRTSSCSPYHQSSSAQLPRLLRRSFQTGRSSLTWLRGSNQTPF